MLVSVVCQLRRHLWNAACSGENPTHEQAAIVRGASRVDTRPPLR